VRQARGDRCSARGPARSRRQAGVCDGSGLRAVDTQVRRIRIRPSRTFGGIIVV
jgi:hypothetical protein